MAGVLTRRLREQLRRRLEQAAARLEEEARSLREGAREHSLRESVGELAAYDQHTSDLGAETFERSKDLGLLDRLEQTAQEVRAALGRLEQDRYGYCEACGRFMGVGRLLALPWARRCAPCQEAHDRSHRRTPQAPTIGRRPLEEAALLPPFGRADLLDVGEAGLGPDDVWQLLARQGNANSPQDVPGAVEYDEVWEGADTEPTGAVSEVEAVPDVAGTGVVDFEAVYPEPGRTARPRREAAPEAGEGEADGEAGR